MGFNARFTLGLLARLALLLGAVALLALSLTTPGLGAARIVAGLLVASAAWLLWRHVERTNREVARFVEAIRFGDMTARFGGAGMGGGFDELGAALDAGMARMRDERARDADIQRFHEALVDDAPAAILVVDPEGRITPINKSARRLFPVSAGVRAADYAPFGADLAAYLADCDPSRRLVQLMLPTGPQRAMARSAAVQRLGGLTRVVVIQPIQDALNAVEVAAQSDLIRVLTHEIMNSMTPVTSLARTAAGLMRGIDDHGDPAIADAREAVETLSRRADGVTHFVETYRQVSRAPEIRRRRFAALPFAQELERLFAADWPADRATLTLAVAPADLGIDADPDLLAQVLINLLRNGAEAASAGGGKARLTLAMAAIQGGGVRIDVTDNGPGVPEAMRGDIFLPFFTTKAKGTGVGLSFARQVVLAHDGSIQIDDAPEGGARFRINI